MPLIAFALAWNEADDRKYNQCQKLPLSFIILFRNMLFPMLTAEWLHLVLYFSTEYNNPYATFESATNVGGWLSVLSKTFMPCAPFCT